MKRSDRSVATDGGNVSGENLLDGLDRHGYQRAPRTGKRYASNEGKSENKRRTIHNKQRPVLKT
jgi:hypothetical protein